MMSTALSTALPHVRTAARLSLRTLSTAADAVEEVGCVVIGGGPVGGSASWFLAEHERAQSEGTSIVCVHDPRNRGAHEDWSRLARLSFDGPAEEMQLSRHALELLDLVDEVRSMNSGAPVVPVRPGMVFLASPGTALARALAHGAATYGDEEFRQVDWRELEVLFPGNGCNLPEGTLAWTHPAGYCVSPLELAESTRRMAEAYGVELVEGRAQIDCAERNLIRVTLDSGRELLTRRCFLFAGAASKQIVHEALAREPERNAPLFVPEFDSTYITAISTVRYKHVHHPASPAAGSGHVVTPIILGQIDAPDHIDFQANFSIVAEEYGDVLKTRLSGSVGSEVIDTVADLARIGMDGKQDAEMATTYQRFFGACFPFLETETPLDFNRCVTYRNHVPAFSGTSLVAKEVAGAPDEPPSSLMTTVGCFGVGVKFGPALGQAAAAHTFGDELVTGMDVFTSGDPDLEFDESGGDMEERAY